jgi:glucose/mannose-6-phosphate isomerase
MESSGEHPSEAMLDDSSRMTKVDASSMRNIMLSYPESCLEAYELAKDLDLPKRISKPRNIVFAGMGGSSLGANLIKAWTLDRSEIPIEICQDYHLPSFVDKNSFVVAVSYSGNTEETLTAFVEAVERGCTVASVTSGGKLMEFSDKLGVPCVRVAPGLPPRGALPYLFMPLIQLIQRAGIKVEPEDITELIEKFKEMRNEFRPETPFEKNRAKQIAFKSLGYIPVVYGWGIYVPVAQRIKCQLNENSKIPAFWSILPEADHNDAVGWDGDKETSKKFCVLMIRDPQEPEEMWNRIESTNKIVLKDNVSKIIEIQASGKSALARMISVLYLGDFVSLYTAVLRGVDPTPVNVIERLKNELSSNLNMVGAAENKVRKLKGEMPEEQERDSEKIL